MASSCTAAYATKYERTKMIGMRLEQLARGAAPLVEVTPGMSIREVVMRELEEKKLPFKVVRTLPNGDKMVVRACDLQM
jgi:DNA-directed RNA polymerase subunit K/omega